tara:strand:+ start:322 stop:669 length:348 start_codon:yes stop_codon:yes gene_type:complete
LFPVIFLSLGYSITKKVVLHNLSNTKSLEPITQVQGSFPTSHGEKSKETRLKKGHKKIAATKKVTEEAENLIDEDIENADKNHPISSTTVDLYKKAQTYFEHQNLNKVIQTLSEP